MTGPPGLAGPGPCLVTGSEGYLGRHLVAELLRRGYAVRGFDLAVAPRDAPGFEAVPGDVRDEQALRVACRGVDTVFHTAARLEFGSFVRRSVRRSVWDVNVGGVRNLLAAARSEGVQRVVYTSSNNVTLDGPVEDGDETWPYAARTSDVYTETKIRGEQLALAADGERLSSCAIRPGGLYGPGESHMLPAFLAVSRAGLLWAVLGDGSARSDNVFIDHAVDAHIQAARHLAPGSALSGQAYFVSDGAPINYFEFFALFLERLGRPIPRLRLPGAPARALAWLGEAVHFAFGAPEPFLTRLEVRKMLVTHYNRNDKAKRDFAWEPTLPVEEAVERCLPYCRRLLEG